MGWGGKAKMKIRKEKEGKKKKRRDRAAGKNTRGERQEERREKLNHT